jgi:glutathione peroxidase-family protein
MPASMATDSVGNMANWWSDEDRANFTERADKLIEQYNGFEPREVPGQHVNGDDRHPLYAELTKAADADGESGDVQWNFEKFLLDADGTVVRRYRPQTQPDDPDLVADVEQLLPR